MVMNIINTIHHGQTVVLLQTHTWVCVTMLSWPWCCGHVQTQKQGEVVYANYWLEFSQHKLTDQLKTHYADISLTFIRHIAMHIKQPVSEVLAH